MTCHLDALCLDADDPAAVARFWAGILGWEGVDDDAGAVDLLPTGTSGFRLRFLPVTAPRVAPNRLHLHLTSQSPEDQQARVARALELGARHIDVGQRPEEGHAVLADPGDNEFCVLEPGNRFLAECGFLAEVTCDGSRAVGRFWSEALGWPLVWDQDEETSIRASGGSTNISWGGPPVAPKVGRNRQHLDVVPDDGDQQAAVEWLLSLGATRLAASPDAAPHRPGSVVLADPDGNELCVLAP
jgi:catechol 2,3-dioxygenase-like lactoylglutathione lyase family enzyme